MNRLSGLPLSRKPDKRSAIRQSVPDGGLNALSGLLAS
ncbi:adenylate kinase [Salmonella enterica subsp. enterica serovar Cubana]|nr:adenylate kinase [Salmonella enterica subsp. enterica serovar Cubana]